jgi:excisionase family DNA binding protein
MDDAKLLSLNELSERTGLPTAWLRREAEAGRLPFLWVGRRRMFNLAAVERILAERASAPAPMGEVRP